MSEVWVGFWVRGRVRFWFRMKVKVVVSNKRELGLGFG
jgi:hypothetical protein